jgi:hypothetical protein
VVGVKRDFVSGTAHLESGDVGTSQEALSLVGGMTSDASNCSVLMMRRSSRLVVLSRFLITKIDCKY